MELNIIYENIEKIIKKIDFSKLWPGFYIHKFALYNDDKVIIDGNQIKKTEMFVGNTAIKYQGEYIAIWNLMGSMDEEILASKIIHEMFHAFQYEQNESRFPDEFETIFNYENNLENFQIKFLESEYLLNLDKEYSNEIFNEFLNLRLQRRKKYSYQYNYESKIEIVEGMAQYIEVEALKQIDMDKYVNQLKQIKSRISTFENYFPIRIVSYDIGTLLIKILVDNKINFEKSLKNSNNLLLHKLFSTLKIKDIDLPLKKEVDQVFKNDLEKLDAIIINAKKNHKERFEGEFTLKGFNVYNARYHKGFIYSKFFIILEEKGLLYGDYLLKTKGRKVVEVYKL
ncbi:MAG: hypothetical protein K9L64_03605 [Candidatus Izimaplasma sp.]|nr:hypothetical protein [Candidatus Izimaplasma bacterium]